MRKSGVFLRVLLVHALILGGAALSPLMKGCTLFEKEEQVITVDLGGLPPPPPDTGEETEPEEDEAVEENVMPEETPEPERVPTAVPTATPTPAPQATSAPAPAATPRPHPTPTPSWRAKTPGEIRQAIRDRNRNQPEPAPALSAEQIRKMIAAGLPMRGGPGGPAAGSGEGGGVSFDGVGRELYARLYSAWRQPMNVSAASGLNVLAVVEVRKSGAIASARVKSGSGHAEMDASVRSALSAVTRVGPLPAEFRGTSRSFEIEFVITR